MISKVLTTRAEGDLWTFHARFGVHGNCSCHISAPCISCRHPGNPINQNEDESCWEFEWLGFEAMEQEARNAVEATIEDAAGRHLTEMGVGSAAYLYGYNKGWEAQCVASSALGR